MVPLSIDFAPERGVACGASSKVSSFGIGRDEKLVISALEDTPSEGASSIAIRWVTGYSEDENILLHFHRSR